MRIVRFEGPTAPSWGIVDGDDVIQAKPDPTTAFEPTGARFAMSEVRLLAPCEPSKIIIIGINFLDHAKERGKEPPVVPRFSIASNTSVVGPGADVIIRHPSHVTEYEAELAVVMGREFRGGTEEQAMDAVLGYTCGNDISDRDLQRQDGYPSRGKSLDTFTPLGPWIETDLDPSDLAVRLRLNDQTRQDGRTSLMVHPIPKLLCHIGAFVTLLPGDVVLTGTPAGTGRLAAGDRVDVEVEGIGTLSNRISAANWEAACPCCDDE